MRVRIGKGMLCKGREKEEVVWCRVKKASRMRVQ